MKHSRALYLVTILALLLPGVTASRATDDEPACPPQLRWIWYPEGQPNRSAPEGTRYFRGIVTLPTNTAVTSAQFILNADDTCIPSVNGKRLPHKIGGWPEFETYDVSHLLHPGRNVVALEAHNSGSAAGVIGWVVIRTGKTKQVLAVTDGSWKAANKAAPGWEQPKFDDTAWPAAMVLGPVSIPPWSGKLHYAPTPLMNLTKQRGEQPVTPEQAQALIEEDWIFQATDATTAKLALDEINWTRELAARLTSQAPALNVAPELARLAALEARLHALPPTQDDDTTRALYLDVRRLKRALMLRNPLLDFDRVLLVDGPQYAGVHESAHRNGYHYGHQLAGSRLLVLDGLRPDGVERELVPGAEGYIMRMDLSFDATKIVFSLKPKADDSFHLYEIGLDGANRRQLTKSPYDDMDPIYLPDGHILFSTSRCNSYVRCLPQSASTVLARCDGDGRNIVMISRNNEPDYTPTLLPDGRVLYTRWEYTERPLWRLQKLWTMNPDGTGEAVYWGNGSAYPDVLWEARPVPGSGQVMFVGVGHHNVVTGCLGLLDRDRGLQWPDGITKITRELKWPEVGEPEGGSPIASPRYHSSGGLWSVRSPYPLGPEDFLVSAARTAGGDFALFLMDIHGNRELLYAGRQTVWYAQPIRPRTPPPAIPSRVAWPAAGEQPQGGVLFSANVYSGVTGLPPGTAKYLRVLEMDAKTYSMGFKSWRHSGPAISVIQEDGVKRILGTVPIQPDGSVAFRVPAGRALHFQLLDDRQRCVQIMRSFTGVMPGETRGCLGCHALHTATPDARSGALALRGPPADLTPPPWGAATSISYERFCQPILDKHCGQCHEGNGKARAKFDMTLRGGVPEKGIDDPKLWPFKEPYMTLIGPGAWGGPKPEGTGAALGLAGCLDVEMHHQYGPLQPMTMLSATSRLIELATSGKHHGVKIAGEDLLRLIAWVVTRTGKTKQVLAVTDGSWKAANQAAPGWEQPKFDDTAWPAAMVLGPVSIPPWGGKLHYTPTPLMNLTKQRGEKPVTPEQAQALIEEDWIFQANDATTARLALEEVNWTRELAARLTAQSPALNFTPELAKLATLETRLRALPPAQDDDATRGLYLDVRRLKRALMLRNPLLDFDRVLLVDGPQYAGVHESAHRNGYYYGHQLAGSRLLVLDGLRPDGVERELVPGAEGYIMRMDLSFDATKIVFSLKPKADDSFHLYEIGLDGANRRQLTKSPYDDMDPIYLPDGHIIFSTSRCNSYVRCLPQSASTVLARCDGDGRNIVMISRNNEPDYTPTLLPDGRVLYTRWEYTERPLWRLQKLWTMNPDGTGEAVYWGNGSAYPDVLWEARPVPGSGQVMFVGVGHHNVVTGCLGLLDRDRGLQWPDGITKITRELKWPEVGEPEGGSPIASPRYHSSGGLWSVRSPYPLGPEDFLVSAARTAGGDFALFLMDIHGNRELLYAGRQTVWYAQPIHPRTPPPAIPSRVAWPAAGEQPQGGVLFSANVYSGVTGLPPGTAKYLRVLEMDAKTYSMGFKSWRHSGPAISVIQEDGVKRILGTVPIQPDGSVAFRVPAGRALHFQLLDDRQRCVQIMRSFTGVMPGETRGCLGCHALHTATPDARSGALALRGPPADLTPPPWGAATSISYERFCQPILDKHCGQCHEGNGKARAKFDMTLRGGVPEKGIADPKLWPFKEPYMTLVGPGAWGGPKPEGTGAALGLAGCLDVEMHHQYGPLQPMTMLSATSRLIELATSGKHHGVKIEGEDLLRLIAWVDCNCVYRGDEEVRQIPDPPPEIAGHFPVPVKTRTAPHIDRLQPVSDTLR